MSDDIHFDKYVKEQLGKYTPPVPPDMWDRITAARKKKKPAGAWLWLTGRPKLLLLLLVLAGGSTGYWLWQQGGQRSATVTAGATPAGNTIVSVTTPEKAAQPGGNVQPGTVAPSAPAAENAAAAAGTIVTPPVAGATTPQNGGSTGNNGTADAINKRALGDRYSNGTGYLPVAGDDGLSPNNSKHVYSSLTIPQPAAYGGRFVRSKPVRRSAAIATVPGNGDATAGVAPADYNSGTAGSAAVGMGAALPPMYFPASRLASAAASPARLRSRNLRDLMLPDCPSIEDDAAGNKRYFDVYAGPDLGLRSFNNFGADSSSAAYAQKRRESTRFQSAFSAGVRFTRVFSNGMSLRGGVNYSQVNEKFEYVNEKDIRYVLIVTPRDIIGPGGVVTTVFDTVRYTETGKRIKTTHNRYRSIDIPLQIGYEFGNGRLHTNISAGAIINLYSWQRGDVLDTTLRPVSITTGKGNGSYGFRTNMGVGFLGSVSVYYKLNSRLHLMAEPYFRYSFQPMTNENLNITQKYNMLGLRLGIRWDLK